MDPVSRKLLDIATSAQGDAPSTANQPLDPERRAFLEAAMSSLTYDVAKKMKELIAIFAQPGSGTDEDREDEVIAALEDLEYEVQRADAASDLEVLGGFDPLFNIVFGESSPAVRSAGLWVVATAAQNNPKVQEQFNKRGLVARLVELLKTPLSAATAKRAILAVSAIIRGFAPALQCFAAIDGLSAAASSALRAFFETTNKDGRYEVEGAASSLIRLFAFLSRTLLDRESDLPGTPRDAAQFVSVEVATALAKAAATTDTDIASLAVAAIQHVVSAPESTARTVAMARLRDAGAAAAMEGAVELLKEVKDVDPSTVAAAVAAAPDAPILPPAAAEAAPMLICAPPGE